MGSLSKNIFQNKRMIFLVFFSLFFSLSFVSAIQTYAKFDDINLRIPFEVNGSIASDSAYCNVSIKYPNETYLIDNGGMTNENNGYFNYSLNTNQTNTLGTHNWVAFCCDGTDCAMGYGDFEVTPSGFGELGFSGGFGLASGILATLVIGVVFFIASLKANNIAFRLMFLGLMGVMFISTILFSITILTQVAGGYEQLISGMTVVWFVLRWVVTIGLLALVLYSMYMALKLWQIKRGLSD